MRHTVIHDKGVPLPAAGNDADAKLIIELLINADAGGRRQS